MARRSACARLSRLIAPALVAMILSAALGASNVPRSRSPRLREGLPAQIPHAFGGGEVVLELTVDSRGGVTRIERIRVTPPYADLVVNAAAQWRFGPATAVIEGRATPVAASVLVVAVVRPASLYAGPAPGVPPQLLGAPSPRIPRVESIVMPAYPPTATGDGIVLIEIEMSGYDVAVTDDIVTLTGPVGSWSQHEAAERGAGSAPGIRRQIRVVPQEPHEFEPPDEIC